MIHIFLIFKIILNNNPTYNQILFPVEMLNAIKDIIVDQYQGASILPPANIERNDPRIEPLRLGQF